ncbi:MAG: hypothetical protein ACM3KJ_02480, partial [Bacillota bacterium]
VTYSQTHHLTDAMSQWLDHKLDKNLDRQGPLDPAKVQGVEALKQLLHAVPDIQKTGQPKPFNTKYCINREQQ